MFFNFYSKIKWFSHHFTVLQYFIIVYISSLSSVILSCAIMLGFFSFVFWVFFSLSCKTVWWYCTLSAFVCLSLYISPSFLKKYKNQKKNSIAGYYTLVGKSFLSELCIYHLTPFCLERFLLKNPLSVSWEFPCMW